MAPHWPYRRLRTPPGLGSPSPPGRCARFSEADGPPLALQETPNTPWAGLPVPPRPVRPVLWSRWSPIGLTGDSEHPLGWAPRPPQAGAPGSLKQMAPHWPYRRLRTPPGLDSPSPPGQCARFSEEDASPWALKAFPTTPWAGLPVPPRPDAIMHALEHTIKRTIKHTVNPAMCGMPCLVRDALPRAGCPAWCGMPCLVQDAHPSSLRPSSPTTGP